MDYTKQAKDFLAKTNSNMEIDFSHNGKHFAEDKENRDIYTITLSRGNRSYVFNFGQSIANSQPNRKKPTEYDILSCLQKYEIGTFEDFCGDFGYDTDSRQAEKTYKVVLNEYSNLKMLYNDQGLELLQEIQ